MAKAEQRGNREVRKPKKDKPKAAAPVSPFAAPPPARGAAGPKAAAAKAPGGKR